VEVFDELVIATEADSTTTDRKTDRDSGDRFTSGGVRLRPNEQDSRAE
jgi:hypothetical protein